VKLDEGARSISRRSFFGAAAATSAALGSERDDIQSADGANKRTRDAYRIRVEAARRERDAPQPDHVDNGDEALYATRIGNFSKGLPHNDLGEADPYAYDLFVQAMHSGTQAAMDQIPMGNPDPSSRLKLVNPCSGIAFDLQGSDSHHLAILAAPPVASAEAAGEMVEAYWQALARDVPFSRYDTDPTTQAAVADLSKLSDFRGPKLNGQVTADTLFRGFTNGDLVGPYVSQFLLKPVPFGVQWVEQQIRTMLPGVDYLTQYSDWLSVQNGVAPAGTTGYDPVRRYIRSGRDLAQWVHMDVLYQAYFNAMLIMLTPPDPTDDVTGGGMGVPLNSGNPYVHSNESGWIRHLWPAGHRDCGCRDCYPSVEGGLVSEMVRPPPASTGSVRRAGAQLPQQRPAVSDSCRRCELGGDRASAKADRRIFIADGVPGRLSSASLLRRRTRDSRRSMRDHPQGSV